MHPTLCPDEAVRVEEEARPEPARVVLGVLPGIRGAGGAQPLHALPDRLHRLVRDLRPGGRPSGARAIAASVRTRSALKGALNTARSTRSRNARSPSDNESAFPFPASRPRLAPGALRVSPESWRAVGLDRRLLATFFSFSVTRGHVAVGVSPWRQARKRPRSHERGYARPGGSA